MKDWSGDENEVATAIEEHAAAVLKAYEADPELVEEHAGQEREARTGGYGQRQIYELVQNGADQLESGAGRLEVVVTDSALYCANEGRPFSAAGVTSILHAYLSRKDDDQIGRFGLGFKSVLGVTSHPTVLSRSGSFRFGPEIAERIREIAPEAADLPLLRLAAPVDPEEVVSDDVIAAELAEWASTVVVLPFDEKDGVPWLASGVRKFPRPFLVFAGQVESLSLEDRVARVTREISAKRSGHTVMVQEEGKVESWQVFEVEVPLDEDARERAGKLADRDAATVKWAVNPEDPRGLGEFWSYFPTDDETTLRGVINAPWQMSEDRRRLVEGPYNEALLEGASELILDCIEDLHEQADDKAAYLELLPARGREPRCWADGQLTDQVNELAATRPSVPLLAGELEVPVRARLHPADLPTEALEIWAAVAEPGDWIDHTVDRQKDRRARVERYMGDAGKVNASVEEWFAATLVDATPQSGVAAARLAGVLARNGESAGLGDAAFVLTEEMEFVPSTKSGLMLPGKYPADAGSVTMVHPDVADDRVACESLEAFGLRRISAEVELRRLISDSTSGEDIDWEYFWGIARQVPAEDARAAMAEDEDFEPRIRTLDADFKRIIATLLPGPCVPADGSRDAHATVDVQWHREDMRVLQALGCTDGPSIGTNAKEEPWFSEYRDMGMKAFLERNEPARPSLEAIELVPESMTVGPLGVLRTLSDGGKAAMTQVALQSFDDPVAWTVKHSTQSKYKDAPVPNPSVWLIREEGLVRTPLGARPFRDCVGPGLRAGELTPAPSCTDEVARALGLPAAWSEVADEVIEECLEEAADAEIPAAASLYSALASDEAVAPPEVIRAIQSGSPTTAPREEVAVTADQAVFELLASGTGAALYVAEAEDARLLIDHWGLKDGVDLVTRRVAVAAQGDPVVLIDEFPPLRKRLDPALREIELQRCEEIRIVEEVVGGTRSVDADFARDEDRLYCLSEMDQSEVLRGVSRELGLGLSSDDVARVIRGAEDRRTKDLERDVRGMDSDAARLATLIGAEALEAELPRAVREAFIELHGEPTAETLGKLAISVHGTDVLKVYTGALEDQGLNPPSAWRGSHRAKEFVRNLSFSTELAGFTTDPRPPEMIVEGRPKLPPLHDYQRRVVEELCALFGEKKENRAMLSLPTGSGKTRVAIEGCVDALAGELLESELILWIAQSDELCEQAVQAWSELWRARELADRLTISRLWGSNKADRAPSGVQVVVATIQKLQGVIDSDDYAWLSRPGAVVIDEAHGSITKSFTRALGWLGLDRSKFGAPLVGLSATPYRGRSEEESKRLASRYGNRRLDVNVLGEGDHYPKLQKEGVISRVKHEILEGSEITLSEAQRADVVDKGLLPMEAGTRLGEDVARTRTVVEHVSRLPSDWPVLVFAPSVENAQALAGLLNHRGISSATISGETPDEARRWHLRRFRDGDLQVITNYNVLAEGFDAPSVRAVYIARPVFAPNRYQQMVGRGLRGPKNGGKEECLIVDVEDNIQNLDELLAFRSFEYLWDQDHMGTRDE